MVGKVESTLKVYGISSGRQGDFQSMVDDDSVLAVYMVTQAEHRLNSGKGSPLMPAKGAIATKEAL